jgi:hypothetical protein
VLPPFEVVEIPGGEVENELPAFPFGFTQAETESRKKVSTEVNDHACMIQSPDDGFQSLLAALFGEEALVNVDDPVGCLFFGEVDRE